MATREGAVPAEVLGDAGGGEGGDDGARVAGTGDAEGEALVLGRVPAADQREGDGEAGPGDAEEQADAEHLDEGVAAEAPQSSGTVVSARVSWPSRLIPTRSASGPSSRRKAAPPSGGTATTRPFCAGDSPRSSAT